MKGVCKMDIYRYRAKGFDGKVVKGTMKVNDSDELYKLLKEDDLFLIDCQLLEKKINTKKLKTKAVSAFCRQLGTLLQSGITIVRAFTIMAEREDIKPFEKKIYLDVIVLLKQGVSLSEAMEEQGRAFPELLINMFKSAEMSGTLDKTANRMATHYEKEVYLNGKIKSAMMYPIVLGCVALVGMLFIVGYVIPQFEVLFARMESLPLFTMIIMAISGFISNYWYILIAGIALLVAMIRYLLSIEKIRYRFDRFKIKLPYIGNLLKTIYTAHFARTLSSLYTSGLPIVSSLDVGKKTINNKYIESQFVDVQRSLKAGESLSQALRKVDGFQVKLISSIEVGEEAGNLDTMLISISDALDYEAEMAITKLVSILEPLMIVLMGVVVAIIVIGVILPIYNSYATIEQGGY